VADIEVEKKIAQKNEILIMFLYLADGEGEEKRER
jgi:hypothetical protein